MGEYLTDLGRRVSSNWNRFWFTPSDPLPHSVLRILVGLMSLYFLVSHSADLVLWFGRDGLLPIETVQQLTGADQSAWVFRPSYLYFVDSPSMLWIVHVIGLLVVFTFTIGLFTRVTSILSLIVVLSYVHRAPMITGPFEPVLTLMLFYLCLAPAGAYLSIDSLLSRRKSTKQPLGKRDEDVEPPTSMLATVALRLMQVHLVALYLIMGLSKLQGETWWEGEAVWWLMAYSESRLVDLTSLSPRTFLINAWTYAILGFELSFPLLIWNRTARPLLLTIAVVMWSSLALLTGSLAFCLMMLVASLAFVPPDSLRRVLAALLGRFGLANAIQDARMSNDPATEPAVV